MIRFFVIVVFLSLGACASKTPGGSSTDKAVATILKGPIPTGRLDRVLFFADGNRLLWMISREPEHTGAQIYESDLLQGKLRRVTWQDGEIESFDVSDSDRLVYASTTDELKERSHPSERPKEQGLPSEIYLSDRYGDEIARLTTHPGFDGQVAISPRGNEIAYVSKDGDRFTLHKLQANGGGKSVIANGGGVFRYSPVIGEDGKLAWLEKKSEEGPADVHAEGKKKSIATIGSTPVALLRAPQPGWFFWEKNGDLHRVVYLTAKGDCRKTLTEGKENIVWADLSPSPYRIALIVEEGAGTRLLLKDLPANAFTCESESGAAKMNP